MAAHSTFYAGRTAGRHCAGCPARLRSDGEAPRGCQG
jgi:hypothetical protein